MRTRQATYQDLWEPFDIDWPFVHIRHRSCSQNFQNSRKTFQRADCSQRRRMLWIASHVRYRTGPDHPDPRSLPLETFASMMIRSSGIATSLSTTMLLILPVCRRLLLRHCSFAGSDERRWKETCERIVSGGGRRLQSFSLVDSRRFSASHKATTLWAATTKGGVSVVPHVKRTPGIGGVNFGRREMSVVLMQSVLRSWCDDDTDRRRKFHIGEDPIEIIERRGYSPKPEPAHHNIQQS